MGCVQTKAVGGQFGPTSGSSNVFAVSTVNTRGKTVRGIIEVTPSAVVLYRPRCEPMTWPLQYLRRYGYESGVFSLESGRRCLSGAGVFTFRCANAHHLFQLVQQRIQENATMQFVSSGDVPIRDRPLLTVGAANGFSTLPLNGYRRTISSSAATPSSPTYLQPDRLLQMRGGTYAINSESAADLFAVADGSHFASSLAAAVNDSRTADDHTLVNLGERAIRPKSLTFGCSNQVNGITADDALSHSYINVGLNSNPNSPTKSVQPTSAVRPRPKIPQRFVFPPQQELGATASASTSALPNSPFRRTTDPSPGSAVNGLQSYVNYKGKAQLPPLRAGGSRPLTLYHRTSSTGMTGGRVSPVLDYVQLGYLGPSSPSPSLNLAASPQKMRPMPFEAALFAHRRTGSPPASATMPRAAGGFSSHQQSPSIGQSNYARIDFAKTKAIKDATRDVNGASRARRTRNESAAS